MEKELRKDLGKSIRSLASLVVVGGIISIPAIKGYSEAIDLERNEVIRHYDENGNWRIDKKEKKEMIEDLNYDVKRNYKLKDTDFEILYGMLK